MARNYGLILVGLFAPTRSWCRSSRRRGAGSRPPHVDGRGVEHVLDVRGVEFLDHLHAGAAVLGDLINVRPLHQSQADIGMPQAVGGPALALAVEFEVLLLKDEFEQLAMGIGKHEVGRAPDSRASSRRASEGKHGSRHAFAIADAALSADVDLQDGSPLSRSSTIFTSRNSMRRASSGRKPGVGHEQHVVVQFVIGVSGAVLARVLDPVARRLVKLLVLLGGKPRAVRNFAGGLVRSRQVGDGGIHPCNSAVFSTWRRQTIS